jgi:hypothetical protein
VKLGKFFVAGLVALFGGTIKPAYAQFPFPIPPAAADFQPIGSISEDCRKSCLFLSPALNRSQGGAIRQLGYEPYRASGAKRTFAALSARNVSRNDPAWLRG